MEEIRGEVQLAMTSVTDDFRKELQTLRASKATKDGELQACKAEVQACKAKIEVYEARIEAFKAKIKVCMATVANSGSVQVPGAQKGNAPRPSAFHGARNARVIDSFL